MLRKLIHLLIVWLRLLIRRLYPPPPPAENSLWRVPWGVPWGKDAD